MNYEELLGAIARGWCTPVNEKKVMDSDLAIAIAEEVVKYLAAARSREQDMTTQTAEQLAQDIDEGNFSLRDLHRAAAMLRSLAAEIERLRLDAERYRWLREGNFTGQWILSEVSGGWTTGMDSAIDAARAALEQPK